jgi:GAF domain-containing protein
MKRRLVEEVVRHYYDLSDTIRLFIRSVVVPGFGFGMGVLGNLAAHSYIQNEGDAFWAKVLFASVLIILYAGGAYIFERARRVLHEQEQRKSRILLDAHEQTDRVISENLRNFENANHESIVTSVWHDPMFSIKKLMRSLYDTLASQYASQGTVSQLIRFETTFMTKSYIDKGITIAAWENRDGRVPVSMRERPNRPDLYSQTITARVYEATSEEGRFWIIEDTAVDRHFSEVYSRQKDRIRSMIVYPVLSDTNEILGTIVAHCDKAGFFQDSERIFWRELLEMFAKRIALEKKRLDLACAQLNEDLPF